jgi:hypothetical protein
MWNPASGTAMILPGTAAVAPAWGEPFSSVVWSMCLGLRPDNVRLEGFRTTINILPVVLIVRAAPRRCHGTIHRRECSDAKRASICVA